MPRLIPRRDQILAQVQSHERNTRFHRIFIHGTSIDARRRYQKDQDGGCLETQLETRKFARSVLVFEPLLYVRM